MDLYSAEVSKWKSLVQEWLDNPSYELEASFGIETPIGVTTFLDVAKRLKGKGYTVIEQDDYMNICLQDNTRIMINGLEQIREYCEDDTLVNKSFVAMRKDRNLKENNLDIADYDFRVKIRREEEIGSEENKTDQVRGLMEQWSQLPKTFRIIRRWSFEGNGVQFDLSMVRTSQRDRKGNYKFVKTFKEYDVMLSVPLYEIEIELKRASAEDTLDSAFKKMYSGVADILKGIQRTNILIRKSHKKQVVADYFKLTGAKDREGNVAFRGAATMTLLLKNIRKEKENARDYSIMEGYNVTDKADGLRVHAFTDSKGELFMMDQALNVYKTGLKNEECADALLDGEWVRKTKRSTPMNALLLFDAYIVKGEKVDSLPFAVSEESEMSRHKLLTKWVKTWDKKRDSYPSGAVKVSKKVFEFGQPGDGSIFAKAAKVLDGNGERIYHTDGLIFTSNSATLPKQPGGTFEQQFKWKPASQNTIDFMVYFEREAGNETADKVTETFHPETGKTVRYKTLRLYVGSNKDVAEMDPRATILRGDVGATAGPALPAKDNYKPVIFTPVKYQDTMASVCYLEVQTDPATGTEYVMTAESEEPISDKSIVEMAYDPTEASGWRWKPLRVRHDKNEKLARGIIARTLNSFKVAEDTWNSIHEPITERMIRTGADELNEEEMGKYEKEREERAGITKKYWTEKKAPREDMMQVETLRKFHNEWIKGAVLLKTVMRGGGKSLVDIGCGRGGDLHKWTGPDVAAGFVLGVDPAGEDIRDPKAGAYKRLFQKWEEVGRDNVPPIVFAIGDARQTLVDGTAGIGQEEKDILRSIFGRVGPEGPVPKYVEEKAAGRLKLGADVVSCMFAMHYFFESVQILESFMKNLRDIVRPGGYFIGCCFDGEGAFKKLRGKAVGEALVGADKESVLWRITKQYSQEEMPAGDDSVGLAIDVEFISIGQPHREYLVNFNYFTEKMRESGFELLDDTEKGRLGLQNSTAMFEQSWTMAKKIGKAYPMSQTVREFSFMNRWFIFKRKAEAAVGVNKEKEALAVSEAEEAEGEAVAEEVEEDAEEGEGAAAAATARSRIKTVPTTKGIIETAPRKYAPNEIFLFYADAALDDKLKIGYKDAGRWLSPLAPFDIRDPDDGTRYPTVEHFLAGMKVKRASPMPELAEKIFGTTGFIHQRFLQKRLGETGAGAKKLTEKREWELLKEEWMEVKRESMTNALKKSYRVEVNDAAWVAMKDEVLEEALKQRYEEDVKFRKIVEAAKEQGKVLVYYQTAAASELGGMVKEGKIVGDNKIGRIIMTLGAFPM